MTQVCFTTAGKPSFTSSALPFTEEDDEEDEDDDEDEVAEEVLDEEAQLMASMGLPLAFGSSCSQLRMVSGNYCTTTAAGGLPWLPL